MTFRFAKDRWTSREKTFTDHGILSYDKVQHFVGGALLSVFVGPLLAVVFAFLWEVKDGLVAWEDGYITRWPIRYNWGGDGFSWKDFVASIGGVIIASVLFW